MGVWFINSGGNYFRACSKLTFKNNVAIVYFYFIVNVASAPFPITHRENMDVAGENSRLSGKLFDVNFKLSC